MSKTAGVIERVIKRAIAARKETRYVTAKESGVNYATLARFLDDRADVRLSTIEALANYLGLELKPKK
jgi:DNA-binding phage protein